MPKEVSKVWLWTSQNAFLTETNPATGAKWSDRFGLVFGKGFRKNGNIEQFLSYKKLHRTGKLLRSIKKAVKGNTIILSSSSPYAKTHNEGGYDRPKRVKTGLQGGIVGAVMGGKIHSRPFMTPSKQVLRAPKRLLEQKMKQYGWK